MPDNLPQRIQRLKDEIVAFIPCKRNAHRIHLSNLSYLPILNIYVNFANRLVVPKPREVTYAAGFWEDPRARENISEIQSVEKEIVAGVDLTPRLSRHIKFRGYRPDRYDDNGLFLGNKWWNKDFALNAYGIHHLHFEKMEPKQGRTGSDALVFVQFSRDHALMVMVDNHTSLENQELEERILRLRANNDSFVLKGIIGPRSGGYSARERIELAHAGCSTLGCIDGKVVMGAMIASDGSSDICVQQASRIREALYTYDPLFNDPYWVSEQFAFNGISVPSKLEFEWWLQGTNLIMYERRTGAAFPVVEDQQGYAQLAA